MIFSSSIFLVYFLPLVLLGYFLIPDFLKNVFLLLASIFFYSWGAPRFIFVILATTTLDFYLVRWMADSLSEKRRKLFLILSLTLNLGLLFYFKYCNFFVENINALIQLGGGSQIKWTEVILPIGISFYTFESVTYVMDVYRREHRPLTSFLDYQLYILLFPKLIAGPIVRFSEISDQIRGRFETYTSSMVLSGFLRFCLGLAKKVLIANVMARVADDIFNADLANVTSGDCWIGALAYTLQIYFDFSGYSDMAIGIGKMLGFRFPENFNNPYTSGSVTEFWRRWHITLGSWMRNYLYIPLGGNRVSSNARLYFNLWLVFLLSGFWHGAAWSFIAWGAFHGACLVLERLFLLKVLKKIGHVSILITFILVLTGWVLFRADTLAQAQQYITKMYSFIDFNALTRNVTKEELVIFSLALFFSFFVLLPGAQTIQNFIYTDAQRKWYYHFPAIVFSLFLMGLSLSVITASGFNPFIYFRF